MTCRAARSFQGQIQRAVKHGHFNASNVSPSLTNAQVSDMSTKNRQLSFRRANWVLHTSQALIVIGVIIVLCVVLLVMIILWSVHSPKIGR